MWIGLLETIAPPPCETTASREDCWASRLSRHGCLWSHCGELPTASPRKGTGVLWVLTGTRAGQWRYQNASSYVRGCTWWSCRTHGRVCCRWFCGTVLSGFRKKGKKNKGKGKKERRKKEKKGKTFDSDTKESHEYGSRCCARCPERTERMAARPRTAKNKKALKNSHAAHRGCVATTEGKGPVSFQTLARAHPPAAPCGIGHGTTWPGSRSNHSPQPSLAAPPSTERGHSCPGGGGSRFAILLGTSTPISMGCQDNRDGAYGSPTCCSLHIKRRPRRISSISARPTQACSTVREVETS